MIKKLTTLVSAVLLLSAVFIGSAAPASACDPNNPEPCDIQPYEVPGWCKVSPWC